MDNSYFSNCKGLKQEINEEQTYKVDNIEIDEEIILNVIRNNSYEFLKINDKVDNCLFTGDIRVSNIICIEYPYTFFKYKDRENYLGEGRTYGKNFTKYNDLKGIYKKKVSESGFMKDHKLLEVLDPILGYSSIPAFIVGFAGIFSSKTMIILGFLIGLIMIASKVAIKIFFSRDSKKYKELCDKYVEEQKTEILKEKDKFIKINFEKINID